MSRAFVENDQGYDASPRVYVNNMNTPQATVNLPDRRPNNNNNNSGMPMRGGGMGTILGGGGRGDAAAGSNYTGAHVQKSRGGNGRSALHNGDNAPPTTARGEPVHVNLQDVYDRIMRRLQRQMNYAELSRATLAEQYGVDLQLREEEAEAACDTAAAAAAAAAAATAGGSGGEGGEHDGRRIGTSVAFAEAASSSPLDADGAAGEGSRPVSQSTSRPGTQNRGRAFSNTDPTTATAAAGTKDGSRSGARGGGAGTSRLLQFKQQPLPSSTGAGTSAVEDRSGNGDGGGAARSDADIERDLDEQPCPRPLRLVVQHVLGTLLKKLTLAENGSLRDCIVFSFEARALLDRLLKEIPLYTQYTAFQQSAPSGNGGATAAVQQAVTGVYQQLRKRPVLLPRGEYVEEAATGAIRAELVANVGGGNADAGASGGGNTSGGRGTLSSAAATTRLPNINILPLSGTSGGFAGTNGEYNTAGKQGALPDVTLPASYGKSARLAGPGGQNNNATNTNVLSPSMQPREGVSFGRSGSAAPSLQAQRSFRHTLLRDRLSTANASVLLANESFGDVSESGMSGYTDRRAAAGGGAAMANMLLLSESAAAHRATQLVSVGTITEDNSVTTVPQSDYAALQQRVEELQTQLADAQQHRSALAEQLCEEEQYTDQKKRIVQYLRETLVRECNMLRTQLHHATTSAAAAGGSSGLPMLPIGKGGHTQRGMGALGNKDGLLAATAGGGNASMHGGTRGPKHSNGTVLSSSMVMGVSGLLPAQPKSSVDHPSVSGSFVSMHGGNYSVTTNGGGGGGTTGRGLGRLSPQLRHVGAGGGGNAKNPVGYGPSALAGTRNDTFQAELDAVHSLLDLALLAVEEEAVLPPRAAQQLQQGYGDTEVLRHGFRKNAKQQLDELRVEFEERQQALKKSLLQQTAEHNYVAAEQHAEVVRLRALTDTTHVRQVLQESVTQIRAELNRFRMHVKEQLHFFKAILHSTGQGLLHRASLVDNTMSDNVTLTSTLNATKELIESANSLFLPMLTREYECGYHPWPLKVRNTRDPLGHVVQLRFGTTEVVRLRDSLSEFGKLYVAIHQYVMGHMVLPESARPTTGKPLEDLCAALALNPTSHTDVVFAARRCHDVEGQLRKKLARLQARLLWNTYQQRVYTDRSMAALAEAGIDPRVTTLPVSRRIDALAQQRGDLLQARVKIQRERSENAKEVYRLWREKEIDIMEGYPVPQTQRNRLALLSNNGALGGGGMGDGLGGSSGEAVLQANTRTARLSLALKRGSADGNANSITL